MSRDVERLPSEYRSLMFYRIFRLADGRLKATPDDVEILTPCIRTFSMTVLESSFIAQLDGKLLFRRVHCTYF